MNIGFIGFGAMGKVHALAAESIKYFYDAEDVRPCLYGVCASGEESARRYAGRFGFSKVYKDYKELIDDPAIDVVDICTPNVYHYEALKYALENGKNIYCEKPLCASAEEAEEIADAAKRVNAVCGVVFNTRFLLPVMRAKEIVSSGALGRILSYDIVFLHSSATDPSRTRWKQDRRLCGGGVLYDLGSHAFDLAEYLSSPVVTVRGSSQIAYETRRSFDGDDNWKTNADEAFYALTVGSVGERGTVRVGKIFQGTNDDFTFEIFGERGSLRFSLMEPNWLYYYDGTARADLRGETRIECVGRYPAPATGFPGAKAPVGWLRGHIGSMFNYLNAVSKGTAVSPSFEEGARNMKVLDSAYLSDSRGGEPVEVR